MDLELDFLYKNLAVHHLKRDELEYELKIRGLPVIRSETRAVLRKRYYGNARSEQNRYPGLDRFMIRNTVDKEIRHADKNVCEIKQILYREQDGGIRERLRTRLVHYLARIYRLTDYTEEDEDLSDIDMLVKVIRETISVHFSYWSVFRLGSISDQSSSVPRNPFPCSSLPTMQNTFPYIFHPYLPSYQPMPGWHSQVAYLPSNVANQPLDRNNQHPLSSKTHTKKVKKTRKSEPVSNLSGTESGWSSERSSSIRRSNPLTESTSSRSSKSGSESGLSSEKSKKSGRESNPVKSRKHSNPREPKAKSKSKSRAESGWSSERSGRASASKSTIGSNWPQPFQDWWSKFDGGLGSKYPNELFRSITNPSALSWSTIGDLT